MGIPPFSGWIGTEYKIVSYCIECSSDTISFSKVHNRKQVLFIYSLYWYNSNLISNVSIIRCLLLSTIVESARKLTNYGSIFISMLVPSKQIHILLISNSSCIYSSLLTYFQFLISILLLVLRFLRSFLVLIVLVVDLFNDEWLKGGKASRSNADIYLL